MKCLLVLLAVAAYTHAAATFPPDTPEVALAKIAHYNEYARAAAAAGAPFIPAVYRDNVYVPQDTIEVAAAKFAHFAEHAKAAAAAGAPGSLAYPYADYYRSLSDYYLSTAARSAAISPGFAAPIVTPSGYLADTPEVAHAKAAHLYRLYKETYP